MLVLCPFPLALPLPLAPLTTRPLPYPSLAVGLKTVTLVQSHHQSHEKVGHLLFPNDENNKSSV